MGSILFRFWVSLAELKRRIRLCHNHGLGSGCYRDDGWICPSLFQQLVAQQWWVQQKLIAGSSPWQSFADDIALRLMDFTDVLPSLSQLAQSLMRLFDAAGHTNSLTESINSLLKSFLNPRQSFQSFDSMQAYLDLFTLWHNSRLFERGKRQGQSPFRIAGVDTPSDDWLDLLGY